MTTKRFGEVRMNGGNAQGEHAKDVWKKGDEKEERQNKEKNRRKRKHTHACTLRVTTLSQQHLKL